MEINRATWQTAEDITRDLYEYSDLEYAPDMLKTAPPKSISEYRARTSQVKNPGLFDESVREQVGVFISGRGKYIQDRIIKPGLPVDSIPEDDLNIKKRIREVSGLGYGNEIIERALGGSNSDSEDENHESDLVTPNLKLYTTSSEPSSSSTSPNPSPSHLEKAQIEDIPEEKNSCKLDDISPETAE